MTSTSQYLRQGLTACAVLGLGACGTMNDGPMVAWETDGFMAPEAVLHDAKQDILYVSNINDQPNEANDAGFISKVGLDGKVVKLKWVTGLDAPKGMALHGNRLFVSDINKLIEINAAKGRIVGMHMAPAAKFLNDVAVGADGSVYVSDMLDDAIYRLKDGEFDIWVQDKALMGPNGLMVEGDGLLVASWGVLKEGFATSVAGHINRVTLDSAAITSLGSGTPVGNLDGLEPDGMGGYLSTDWMAGGLYRIQASGAAVQLLDLNQGSADLEYVEASGLAIIPMMMDGKVVAHKIY